MDGRQNPRGNRRSNIGIYAGSFNPVHAGHIAFALQAMQQVGLDAVYFLPERQPRHKPGVEHFGHRVAMIRRAIQPHPKFGVLELHDIQFSVQKTLPGLQKRFPRSMLWFLIGSDVVPGLQQWPYSEKLIGSCGIIVGLRSEDDESSIKKIVEEWPTPPKEVLLFPSYAADVSSSKIRSAISERRKAPGLLPSVQRYSDKHWLYVSFKSAP